MYSLKDDNGPEKSKTPNIADMVEKFGLDEGSRSNKPVEGRERWGLVIFRDRGSGIGRDRHHSFICRDNSEMTSSLRPYRRDKMKLKSSRQIAGILRVICVPRKIGRFITKHTSCR